MEKSLMKMASRVNVWVYRLTGGKVMLNLWVKVKENWADNERALRQFGYDQS